MITGVSMCCPTRSQRVGYSETAFGKSANARKFGDVVYHELKVVANNVGKNLENDVLAKTPEVAESVAEVVSNPRTSKFAIGHTPQHGMNSLEDVRMTPKELIAYYARIFSKD